MSDLESPIRAKYDGICHICGGLIVAGKSDISPFFFSGGWRHSDCIDLFCIPFIYSSNCQSCTTPIEEGEYGYWSKHNGTWCLPCGNELRPTVNISISYEFRRQINRKKQ